jgi:hypothetical protein
MCTALGTVPIVIMTPPTILHSPVVSFSDSVIDGYIPEPEAVASKNARKEILKSESPLS